METLALWGMGGLAVALAVACVWMRQRLNFYKTLATRALSARPVQPKETPVVEVPVIYVLAEGQAHISWFEMWNKMPANLRGVYERGWPVRFLPHERGMKIAWQHPKTIPLLPAVQAAQERRA